MIDIGSKTLRHKSSATQVQGRKAKPRIMMKAQQVKRKPKLPINFDHRQTRRTSWRKRRTREGHPVGAPRNRCQPSALTLNIEFLKGKMN
jgi:hypothetical protein